jgi:4-hydroxy-2-oxoheptanedioate aldolase
MENRLKKILHRGEVAMGLFLAIPSPELVEMMGEVGFDFVIIDMEHGAIGLESARICTLAADAVSLVALVRVADKEPTRIEQALDFGARGVVVPHVNSGEDALRVVQAAKYPPWGTRGYNPSVRGGRFGRYGGGPEYTAKANEETLVIPVLEEPSAFENLEPILAVKGVDAIFPGPGDLSASLGLAGQLNHPAVQQKIEQAIVAARSRGVAAACLPSGFEDARRLVAQGAQLVAFKNDIVLFRQACLAVKQGLEEAIRPSGKNPKI